MFEAEIDRLGRAVMGRKVVPGVPPGRAAEVGAEEPDESPGVDVQTDSPSDPFALFIRYVAADGAESARRITVRQLVGHPPELIMAFCHERRAPRHFRLDRIVEAVWAETGEVIELAGLAAVLSGAGAPAIDRDLRRVVNVLVFLMRCDGIEHPAEWAAIDHALAAYVLRFGGDGETHAGALRLARQVAPNSDDFMIAMRSFAARAKVIPFAGWIEAAILAVADADGVQADTEFKWFAEAFEFLRTLRNARERKW